MADENSEVTREMAVCLALYSTMNSTLQLYRELLEPWGLTYQQYLALSVVNSTEDVSPGLISETLGMDSSTVAGILKRLERDGFIERSTSEHDRRRVSITATARAKQTLTETAGLGRCVAEAMSIDRAQATDLLALLHQLRTGVTEFALPDPSARKALIATP